MFYVVVSNKEVRLIHELRIVSLVVFTFCSSFYMPKLPRNLLLKDISLKSLKMKAMIEFKQLFYDIFCDELM